MVHIYTFCDKTIVGKKDNRSASMLSENLYKMNFIIDETCIFPSNYNYENLTFKNKDIYFILMQKSQAKLNSNLANLSSCELAVNETLKKVVTDNYNRNNQPLEKESENEWLIPSKAIPITNPNGKTQGYLIKISETTVFVLPNNFAEFYSIYYDCLSKYLEDNYPTEYKSETFKTFGLSEELLYNIIKDQIKNKDKVSITIFSKGLENDIVIKSKQNNEKFNQYRQTIFDKLEKYIFAVQQVTMDEYLESLIKTYNTKLKFVGDSSICKVANNLSVETINNNIESIVVLSSRQSKLDYGINNQQIAEFGENSAEIAYSLAVKGLQNSSSDLIISTIADITDNKSIVYIAIGNKLKIDIYKNQFYGDKQSILENINQTIKFYLIKKLKLGDYKTIQ